MSTAEEQDWFDPDATTFGDRLAGAREEAGLSQADMALKLGVKLKTIEAWEDDRSDPRANKLQMIAGLLNISLQWLLSGEGAGPDQSNIDKVSAMLSELQNLRAQMQMTTERMQSLEQELQRLQHLE